jgi:hypothetical protein
MATDDGSTSGGSDLSRVLTWVIIAVAALFVLRVAMMLVGVAAFVMWRLAPIALVIWLVVMAVRFLSRKPPSTDGV